MTLSFKCSSSVQLFELLAANKHGGRLKLLKTQDTSCLLAGKACKLQAAKASAADWHLCLTNSVTYILKNALSRESTTCKHYVVLLGFLLCGKQ